VAPLARSAPTSSSNAAPGAAAPGLRRKRSPPPARPRARGRAAPTPVSRRRSSSSLGASSRSLLRRRRREKASSPWRPGGARDQEAPGPPVWRSAPPPRPDRARRPGAARRPSPRRARRRTGHRPNVRTCDGRTSGRSPRATTPIARRTSDRRERSSSAPSNASRRHKVWSRTSSSRFDPGRRTPGPAPASMSMR